MQPEKHYNSQLDPIILTLDPNWALPSLDCEHVPLFVLCAPQVRRFKFIQPVIVSKYKHERL